MSSDNTIKYRALKNLTDAEKWDILSSYIKYEETNEDIANLHSWLCSDIRAQLIPTVLERNLLVGITDDIDTGWDSSTGLAGPEETIVAGVATIPGWNNKFLSVRVDNLLPGTEYHITWTGGNSNGAACIVQMSGVGPGGVVDLADNETTITTPDPLTGNELFFGWDLIN